MFILLQLTIFSLRSNVALAYVYAGYKWSQTSANYYINGVFAPSFRTAMHAADYTWNNAGSAFQFHYQGTTNRNPNVWAFAPDGYNDIGFYKKGNIGVVTVLASVRNETNGKAIVETDTTFNTSNNFTTDGELGKYDVQNVMTHEFGHWLKLEDLTGWGAPSWCEIWEFESTMCDHIEPNETRKRSLENDDKEGIKSIYGT